LENDYSSIGEAQQRKMKNSDTDSNLYSSIPPVIQSVVTPSTDSNSSDTHLDYEQITSASSITPTNNNYESLSMSESEPSMRYLKENPYERLHNEDKSPDSLNDTTSSSTASTALMKNSNNSKPGSDVDDFFKV
jgi:hypothetical protein